MSRGSGDVLRERYCFIWKTDVNEHKAQEIIFGSFKLILEFQPKICQSMVYIFLYDKGQSAATFDIKTYVLNKEEKEEFEQVYKGSLKYGPTIWSMERCELLKNENTFCTPGKLAFGFEICPVVKIVNVPTCSSTPSDEEEEEMTPTFLEKMSLDFGKLFDNEENSNTVLNCVDRQIKAHRCILSARSDVFAAMFRSDMLESQEGVVTIKDVAPEILQRMLWYIYSGKVEELTVKSACELYKASDQYGIGTLKNRCASFLLKNLSIISACDVLLLANTYSDQQLEKSAMNFMVENSSFLLIDQWKKFLEEHPSVGIKVYRKYADQQAQIKSNDEKCISSAGFNMQPNLELGGLPVQPTFVGQTTQSGFRQTAQSGFEQAAQSSFRQTAQSGFGQVAQSSFRQTAQAGSEQAVQSIFRRAAQLGFGQAAQSGSRQALQSVVTQTAVALAPPCTTLTSTKSVSAEGTIKAAEEKDSPSLAKMSLDFRKLFEHEMESDIILKCADRQFKVHRCILSARSEVFVAMFRSMLESQEGVVTIKDVAPETLQRMLRYIYSGIVEELTVETASELYKASDQYSIQLLEKHCVSFLTKNLSQISACDVLLLADTYSDEQLENSTMDFMVKNCAFLSTDKWNKFCEKHPALGNKVYRKYVYKQPASSTGLRFKPY